MIRNCRVVKKTFILSVLLGSLAGWARPNPPTTIDSAGNFRHLLDYVIVEINGESQLIKAGGEVTVIYGDQFLVKSAFLNDKNLKVGVVNVVGFPNAKKGGSEDRGVIINTATDLLKNYSEAKEGKVYAITSESGKKFHGSVFIKILEPSLKYATVRINDKEKILRDGEVLKIKKSDLFKVTQVETNVQDPKTVSFQIFEQKTSGQSLFEIRFTRESRVFARIPLKIEE